ncbi:MAG: bifunctional metallophosphatase/5'-nucleotidase [Kofleriaceae bacterium]|nr:bifunctional metallophosphatase/5'-nucleotidase [Myxococcales bacterium]MCB9564435.1 bifunctional metallophosphatase/5'-nucleotidase [Kofleriaceae bacterium]MCB9573858.1 bifunctional metallophosphatase/5'-nucleotidase [Kofleriaceae bacterium]
MKLTGAWSRVAGVVALLGPVACGGSSGSPDAQLEDAQLDAADGPATVHVLAFNDLGGALTPSADGRGGVAYLAGEVARRRTDHTVVVSAGDLIGASPLISALFHDEPTIEAMNVMGLDLAAVGSHEFDEGTAELQRMQHGGCHPVDGCTPGQTFDGASFQYLAANVVDTTTGEGIFPATALRTIDGVVVGFVGLASEDTPATTLASGIPELAFADELETVQAVLPGLRDAGAQVIVVLVHAGGVHAGGPDDCDGLAGPIVTLATALDGEVAMIVGGRTNDAYACRLGNVVVTSAGSAGQLLTDATLTIDRATGVVLAASLHNATVTTAKAPDAAVAAVVDHYDALVAPRRDQVVATITTTIGTGQTLAGELPMGDVIADAMLEATATSTGAQAALMNRGGVRAALTYAASPPEAVDGQVTYGEAFAVQPFSNLVSTVTLSGADLALALDHWSATAPLQVAGLTYTWHASAAPGARVTPADIVLGGAAVEATQSYRVTVNSIVGDPGTTPSMAGATDTVGAGIDLDLLVSYLAAHSPVGLPDGPRIFQEP